MEEDHDFTEFENVTTIYRRRLLPWWIWGILFVYTVFRGLMLISDLYGLRKGYVFVYDFFGINVLISYPYYPVVSALLYLFMLVTVILLWMEHKKAAITALYCFGLLLAICAAILAKGLLSGRFYLRFEMIIFIDLVLRLSDNKKQWENGLALRYKQAEQK